MAVSVRIYQRANLAGVIGLCQQEGWLSFAGDPERAHRSMTAVGVTTVVAVDEEAGAAVVGFACLQSDGEIQAHLSLINVGAAHRRRGIARALIAEALARAGGERIDLVTDSAEAFYERLAHRRMAGYRLYPPFDAQAAFVREAPQVRPVEETDRDWVAETLARRWGSTDLVSRGRRHDGSGLAGMLAEIDGERLGLATYRVEGDEVEIVTMDALVEARGIGTALLKAVADRAGAEGCRRLWLVTTNDNLDALRFYQRRGLRLVAVHRGAVDQARQIKPQIPEVGGFGVAVHDEIELDLDLPTG
jgi:ribosomal protein S18 acetylase RimI-like enzyme